MPDLQYAESNFSESHFTFGPPRDFHDKTFLDNLARRQRTSKCQQARIMD